jgi:hypothetical protein
VLVAGPRPAVRDATFVQPEKGGVSVVARAMVSKVTPADGLRLALRFVAGPALGSTPPWQLSSARVKVTRPDRSTATFEVAPLAREQPVNTWRPNEVVVDGSGLTVYDFVPWKTPEPGLLSKPGRYTVRLEGKLDVATGPVDFATAEVPFEVEAASPALVPLAEIDASVVAAVEKTRGTKGLGKGGRSIVDDVSGGRWVRATLDMNVGYDVTIVDTLVSPAGAVVAMQEFSHFMCVARGTVVATPRGDAPIESLVPGDTVWGWDVERGGRVETPVLSIRESARERTIELGGARLTAEHPVWADGRWTPAAEVAPGARLTTFPGGDGAVATPTIVTGSTAVFDLSVGWPHTFFAGGVLVHNKAVPTELAKGDPWKGLFSRTTDAPLGQCRDGCSCWAPGRVLIIENESRHHERRPTLPLRMDHVAPTPRAPQCPGRRADPLVRRDGPGDAHRRGVVRIPRWPVPRRSVGRRRMGGGVADHAVDVQDRGGARWRAGGALRGRRRAGDRGGRRPHSSADRLLSRLGGGERRGGRDGADEIRRDSRSHRKAGDDGVGRVSREGAHRQR